MKTRYIVLSAFVAAFLSNGLKAFAQINTYSNVTINHKISQFYNTTYQFNNRRSEQTDPYANDTFDDESDGWAEEPVGGNKVQKTHEYRMVIKSAIASYIVSYNNTPWYFHKQQRKLLRRNVVSEDKELH